MAIPMPKRHTLSPLNLYRKCCAWIYKKSSTKMTWENRDLMGKIHLKRFQCINFSASRSSVLINIKKVRATHEIPNVLLWHSPYY